MEEKQKILICDRCNVHLEEAEIKFTYLDKTFRYKVPRCPVCGQASLNEELVNGKMKQVEEMIEEK